jgi:hypothetical protein
MKTDKEIIEGNELIAKVMEYERRSVPVCGDFENVYTIPVYNTYIVGKGTYFSNELKFHRSWDWLMPVVQNLHEEFFKQGIKGRDLMYTIHLLLAGGYLFSDVKMELLPLTLENLYSRVVAFLKWNTEKKGK